MQEVDLNNLECQQEDKVDIGLAHSPLKRMTTGMPRIRRSRTHSQAAAPISVDNWKEENQLDTSIGKSWLYSIENYRSDPYYNPFLDLDIGSSPEAQRPKIMLAKKKLALEIPGSPLAHSPCKGTPRPTGIKSGARQPVENLWTFQPTLE